jgi:WD40-like Beta Propeller Repeat
MLRPGQDDDSPFIFMSNDEKGKTVNSDERLAKTASPRTGIFAAPHAFSGARGSGAPKIRCGAGTGAGGRALNPSHLVASLLTIAATMVFTVASAQAGTIHIFSGSFGSKGSGSGLFEEPTGVAVNDVTHDVYVVDTNNDRVEEFNATGSSVLGQFNGSATPSKAFLSPGGTSGIAIDNCTHESAPCSTLEDPSVGDVYVIDRGHKVIDKFSETGAYLGRLTGTCENPGEEPAEGCPGSTSKEVIPFGELDGVAVSVDGTVWVSQANGTPSGEVDSFSDEVVTQFLARALLEDPFGSVLPGLAVDAEHNIYMGILDSGNQAGEFTATGSSLSYYVPELTGVTGMAVNLTNNEVYYGLSENVDAYSAEGGFIETFGSGHLTGGDGVAADTGNGTVYVADAAADAVEIFDEVPVPDVTTEPPNLQATSVTLKGTVNPHGTTLTSCEFEYGSEAGVYTHTVECSPAAGAITGTGPVAVEANVTGLTRYTTYHYRLVAANENGSVQTPDAELLTGGAAITSESVSDVAATSATLGAQIDPNGIDTHYYFQYSTENTEACSPTHKCEEAPAPSGADLGAARGIQSLERHIQRLEPGMIYHYRVVTVQGSEVFAGPDQTFTTQRSGESLGVGGLPDHRQWELVSPPDKYGATLEGFAPGGTATQASEDGGAITYAASSSTEANPPGDVSPESVQVFSARGGGTLPGGTQSTEAGSSSSWSSRDIGTPHDAPTLEAQVGHESEYQVFSADLSFGLVEPVGDTLLSPEASGVPPYLRDDAGGTYTPLVYPGNVPAGTNLGTNGVTERPVKFVVATPDFSHVVLESEVPLVDGGSGGLYEWSAGKPPSEQLQQLGVLPKSEGGAVVGAGDPSTRFHELSSDGSVFFDYGGHLYLQDVAKDESFLLDVAQPGITPPAQDEATFLYASSDGSKVIFSDPQQLTSTPGGGVYECQIAEGAAGPTCASLQLTDLIIEGGLLGASEDGSYLYFVSGGVLAGSGATSPGNNLYVDHYNGSSWTTTFIAQLAGDDSRDWSPEFGELEKLTSRVSPDGRWLAFMSNSSLTGYDNVDASPGAYEKEETSYGSGKWVNVEKEGRPVPAQDEEVYLYDAAANKLVCASCNPTGARPTGFLDTGDVPFPLVDTYVWDIGVERKEHWLAGLIPGWTATGSGNAYYQSRYLSNGGRLFFDSSDALVSQDTNGTEDVYEYEPAVGPDGGPGGTEVSPAQAPPNDSCATGSSTYSARSGGCIGLISSGTSGEESAFLDASENGDDVFFLTAAKLVPQDTETNLSLYDAHVCGAEGVPCPPPPSATPPTCTNSDSCRAAPSPQPGIFSAPPSATFSGVGNVTLEVAPPPKKVTKKTVKCKGAYVKKKVKKKEECIKKKKSKKSAHKPAKGRK